MYVKIFVLPKFNQFKINEKNETEILAYFCHFGTIWCQFEGQKLFKICLFVQIHEYPCSLKPLSQQIKSYINRYKKCRTGECGAKCVSFVKLIHLNDLLDNVY